jgi:hypothetical protein
MTPDSGLVGSVTTAATGTYTIGPVATAATDGDAVPISRRTAARATHEAGVSVGVLGEVPANGFRTALTSSAATFVIVVKALGVGVVCDGVAVGFATMLSTLGVYDDAETDVFDCGTMPLRPDNTRGVTAAACTPWSSVTVAFGSVPLWGDAAIDEAGEVTPALCEDDVPFDLRSECRVAVSPRVESAPSLPPLTDVLERLASDDPSFTGGEVSVLVGDD